jgi:hypothetical protein
VFVGGLIAYVSGSTPVPHFMRRMTARLGGLGEVDAVVYTHTELPRAILRWVREARRALDELGGSSAPLDVTEVGWTTARTLGGGCAPAGLRGSNATSRVPAAESRCCSPDTWLTTESNRAEPEDWFGIANHGSLKPSGRAYLPAVRGAREIEVNAQICRAARRYDAC